MINDNFLNEMAKALGSESYVVPSYLAFGSTVISPSTTSTSLSGEEGSRVLLTDSRSTNQVTFSGTRLAASVLNTTTGDVLNAAALLSASTGGTYLSEVLLSSIIHTTAFDVQVAWKITNARG